MLRASRMAVLALTVAALIALAGIVATRDELRLAAATESSAPTPASCCRHPPADLLTASRR